MTRDRLVWFGFLDPSSFDQVGNACALPRLFECYSFTVSCFGISVAFYVVYFAHGTGKLVIGKDQSEASLACAAVYAQ